MNLGEVTLQDLLPIIRRLPKTEREKLKLFLLQEELIFQKAGEEKSDKWRQEYLAKIQSNSVWSDDVINRIEEAGKELNRWTLK